jgi:multidrug transporter EmrE-like cation transporter
LQEVPKDEAAPEEAGCVVKGLLPQATMNNPMLFLASAVVCEVLWAVMMKVNQGVALRWASVVMALAYVLSLVCLNAACKKLDLSLAYAVWTGSGAVLVALIGVVVFREPLGVARAIGFALVVLGLVALLGFERGTAS